MTPPPLSTSRPESLLSALAGVLLAVNIIGALAVAATVTVEFYDGYEYLLTGWSMAGDRLYILPKNLLLSLWIALVHIVVLAIGLTPTLPLYHVPMLGLNLAVAALVAAWVKRRVPGVTFAAALALAVLNRLFLHYAPFALGDILMGGAVMAWIVASEQDKGTRHGAFFRVMAFAVCLLTRPQLVIIPVVDLLVAACRGEMPPRRAIGVGTVGIGIFLLLVSPLVALGLGVNPLAGLTSYLNFLRFFSSEVLSFRSFPWWSQILHLGTGFSPVGAGLIVAGFAFSTREHHKRIPTVAIACGAYALFLLVGVTAADARYLFALWAPLTLLAAEAWIRLARKSAAAAALVLVAQAVWGGMEIVHFRQPFYRADLHARIASVISQWADTRAVIFATPLATLYPPERSSDPEESGFYIYSFSRGAYSFHARRACFGINRIATFHQRGFPRPDDLETMMPRDAAIIVPDPRRFFADEQDGRLAPIVFYRWEVPRGDTVPVITTLSVDPTEFLR